jgi:PKD repeat protein
VPINTAGLSFEWDWGDGTKKVGLPGVHQYTGPGTYVVRLVVTNNANGCKDTADISVLVDHTNVKNIVKQTYTAYPNPVVAGEMLTLQGLVSAELVWLDATGRTIATSTVVDGSTKVPGGISRGFYFLQVKSSEQQYETRTLWVR